MEVMPCSSATPRLWPLSESDVIPCDSRDQPSLELPRQPRRHQAAMQKGSTAPSDMETTVLRKHVDTKHEGGFQELSLVQIFLEMNNRFPWQPPLAWEEALQPWSEKSSNTVRPVTAPGWAGSQSRCWCDTDPARPGQTLPHHLRSGPVPAKPDPPRSLTYGADPASPFPPGLWPPPDAFAMREGGVTISRIYCL